MAPEIKFTAGRKAIVLNSLRAGETIQQAATDAGVSRSTIQQHVAWGRSPNADDAERAFTRAFDAARAGEHLPPLTEADLLRLLERPTRHSAEGWVMQLSMRLSASPRRARMRTSP